MTQLPLQWLPLFLIIQLGILKDPHMQPWQSQANTSLLVRTYYQQEGYVTARRLCVSRINVERRKTKSVSGGASRASHQKGPGAVRKLAKTSNAPACNTASSSSHDTFGPKGYCVIHDSPIHSTEECYTLAKIKATAREQVEFLGEVTCPTRQKPG